MSESDNISVQETKPNKLDYADFFVKVAVVILTGGWAYCTSSPYIENATKSTNLEYLKQSTKVIPTAQTDMTIKHYHSWGGNDINYCTVTGTYSIKNTGELPIFVNNITVEVFELEYLKKDKVVSHGKDITSISIRSALFMKENRKEEKLISISSKSMHKETISIDKKIGPGARLIEPFGFMIKNRRNKMYAFIGNADAGVAMVEVIDAKGKQINRSIVYKRILKRLIDSNNKHKIRFTYDKELKFEQKELQHIAGSYRICQNSKSINISKTQPK